MWGPRLSEARRYVVFKFSCNYDRWHADNIACWQVICCVYALRLDVLHLQPSQNIPFAKKLENQRTGFMAAMSDSGLKPTVVYHNLTPAELYEKVSSCLQTILRTEFSRSLTG